MANLIFDKVQIEATIDKIVDRTMRMDMTWDWPCGVAYYGICEAYEVTKNERYLQKQLMQLVRRADHGDIGPAGRSIPVRWDIV